MAVLTPEIRNAIGTQSTPTTHLVEAGTIRRFAEAIGDTNPRYYSSNGDAPPTFSRTMRPSPAVPEFDVPYTGVLDGGSEWEYLEPIRPGDRITVTTKLVDLQEKSGRLGDMLLAIRETTFVNQRDATAVRERDTEIYYDDQSTMAESTPEQSASRPTSAQADKGKVAETAHVRFNNVEVGTQLPVLTKRPTIRQLVMYAGASGDFYEIHYDRDFANARGLDEVIVHGALKSAFLGQLLTDWIGEDGDLVGLAVQYRGMDIRDDTLRCTGVVTAKRTSDGRDLVDCDLWIDDELGHRTTHGSATIALT